MTPRKRPDIYATNASCTTEFSMKEARHAMEKMNTLQKKALRQSAEMVAQTTCSVCRRKPTVTRGGWGETVVVCRHIWDQLQTLPKATTPVDPIATLAGLRIEVFDDGPARW